MDFYAQIRRIIAKELALDEQDVVPEARLVDDLGADSLGFLNLAEAISAQYDIDLLSDDLVDMEDVGELVQLVESKVSSTS